MGPGHDGDVNEDPASIDIINATAPIRICDIGGWTDTWFAEHGKVCNIAVSPNVVVQIKLFQREPSTHRVVLDVAQYDERYPVEPGALPGRHPLLEAIVDEAVIPEERALEISISSDAPPGSATGTSAASGVALIGALDALTSGRRTAYEVARCAHRIEVERLGIQSGVQDQLCAAFGGINSIEISPYPHAVVSQIHLPPSMLRRLEQGLMLVYLGRPHTSSAVHDRVIAALADNPTHSVQALEPLRRLATDAKDALLRGDLVAYGRAMIANTDAQRRLHGDLVSDSAQAVIDVAAMHGALGWKVNGAGGEGGSLTLLVQAEPEARQGIVDALAERDPLVRVIPTSLNPDGLRVWRGE
jgi:D-glycero-alpha-D-manno-heptose-7-phosphate kinase